MVAPGVAASRAAPTVVKGSLAAPLGLAPGGIWRPTRTKRVCGAAGGSSKTRVLVRNDTLGRPARAGECSSSSGPLTSLSESSHRRLSGMSTHCLGWGFCSPVHGPAGPPDSGLLGLASVGILGVRVFWKGSFLGRCGEDTAVVSLSLDDSRRRSPPSLGRADVWSSPLETMFGRKCAGSEGRRGRLDGAGHGPRGSARSWQ
mmetsp:Transcript_115028/g.200175  ORF Transcript_115028/g.200175 Transcript_115028/m.200175 type:complete len:202 (+) Transcript_115028:481-1086(+)